MTLAAADSRAKRTTAGFRIGGLTWRGGRIEIDKTGAHLRVEAALLSELAHWAVWLLILGVAIVAASLRRRPRIRVWYAPHRPAPWYLLRGAALWAGFRAAPSSADADAAFYFDDSTQGRPPTASGRMFNQACTDISKTHVAGVFAEVFGYPIAVDPGRAPGAIVEKSDRNGLHDGRIVQAPLHRRPGMIYERLVDTSGADGLVRDLRTPCVGGSPVVVWEKTKAAADRFAIHNRRAVLRDPADVFSPEELARIAAFNARMGLDWGGLDILRDRHDGRIYVVDVNKTDLGPVIALSWADKIRSMNRLSRALKQMVAPALTRAVASRPSPLATLLPLAGAAVMMLAWVYLWPHNAAMAALTRNADSLRAWANLHFVVATTAFVLTYAAAVTLMLPIALILTFAGGYLFGGLGGGFGSIAGATLGAILAYSLARRFPNRSTDLETRFPALRRLREDFTCRPFRYILSMRLMPLTPFTLVSIAAGLARIGAAPLVLGTALGVAPECLVYAAVGAGLKRLDLGSPTLDHFQHLAIWWGLPALALLAWITMRLGRARAASTRT